MVIHMRMVSLLEFIGKVVSGIDIFQSLQGYLDAGPIRVDVERDVTYFPLSRRESF